jgi:hypothetical protein
MKASRSDQAAPSGAATPARRRKAARYVALVAASAASIATSAPPSTPYEERSWVVSDSAAQSFAWEDPSSDIPPEAWAGQLHVTLRAPKGRWRVALSAMQGEVFENGCTWTEDADGSFDPKLQPAALSAAPWGDFAGRCVGLCPAAEEARLEFSCDTASCVGTASLPVVAALRDASAVTPHVCVSAAVQGPAETKDAPPPSGVSIEVKLDPFVKVVDTGIPDGGTEDAGVVDAGSDDAGAEDAGVGDAMAEGDADAS